MVCGHNVRDRKINPWQPLLGTYVAPGNKVTFRRASTREEKADSFSRIESEARTSGEGRGEPAAAAAAAAAAVIAQLHECASSRGFTVIVPYTQDLPQRNKLDSSKTDGSRQGGPCPMQAVQRDRRRNGS